MVAPFRRTGKDRLHERASHPLILHCGVNGNRANSRDRGSLVQAVSAQYLTIRFGHPAREPGLIDHPRQDTRRHPNFPHVWQETLRRRSPGLLSDFRL